MRARLILAEVGIGLRRNLTMTIALVITFAVSLGLFGGALLVRDQVEVMKDYWYDKVQVSIYLCTKNSDTPSCSAGAVTQAQKDQIKADLDTLKPLVEEVYYESSQDAYLRFKEQFKNSPIAQNASPDALPESYRVKLSDPTKYDVIASAFTGRPGIDNVVDQRSLLDKFFQVLGGLQRLALAIAAAMILVTVLLIANAMRVAAFNRRRETGIMRLVGASDFYIQMPFLLEAAIGAAAGAILASFSLVAVKALLIDRVLTPMFTITPFIGWDAVLQASLVLLVLGVVLAMLTAFITLRRYLRV
ncbi:MAG: permease-like cell division protein FtsX [Actinobacteria bacterium]|nr:permease-like cell division protein FtsX [Actinomycetota bacterium]